MAQFWLFNFQTAASKSWEAAKQQLGERGQRKELGDDYLHADQAFYILIILKNELFQPFNIYIVEYQPNKNQLHQDLPLTPDGNSIMSNERCYK